MQQVNIEILTALGLNQLEAEIYTLLLSQEPMTAYKIGKLLGKPTANVYKAIDSLATKGSVIIEEGKSRVCRAIPANEFLKTLEKDFLRKTNKAAQYLSQIKTEIYDERIYKIESINHIFHRIKKMIDDCKIIAIIDAFPKPLAEIRDNIIDAVNRGVDVYIQVYEQTDIPGAHIIVPPQSEIVLKYWASQQLNIVTDGQKYVLALFNQDISKIYH
ncbi:MAG: TrmB family transcriptional regulator, partial [Bacteroidales bacterium]|nr:TrmB family transcriptional regulator [Bacteroidales bacterium]